MRIHDIREIVGKRCAMPTYNPLVNPVPPHLRLATLGVKVSTFLRGGYGLRSNPLNLNRTIPAEE